VYRLVKAQQPDCLMAPVDADVHVQRPRRHSSAPRPTWLACDFGKVDFAGLDAYSSSPAWRPLADEVTPSVNYLRRLLNRPDLPVVLGEFNQAHPSGRSQWLADAGAWVLDPANKVALACLYDVTYGIGYELVDPSEVASFAAVAAQARSL
jgi:hypothetical protein